MLTWYYHPQVQDSVIGTQQADTSDAPGIQEQLNDPGAEDPAGLYLPESPLKLLQQQAAAVSVVPRQETGTPLIQDQPRIEDYTGWNSSRNFFKENGLTGIVGSNMPVSSGNDAPYTGIMPRPANIQPQQRFLGTYDWFLGLFLLLIMLFIWIRIFYNKFFATLANALLSFQISAKLFRDKNVLVKRVSVVLDFIYILLISLFIFELVIHLNIAGQNMSRFNLMLLFLNLTIIYTLLRYVLLWLTGYLFMVQSLVAEYMHNTFIINKGVGIALFPLVIMAHYFPHQLTPIVLTAGGIIFSAAFIFKGIRAYQIIIRKDVLLFYLILYLCTLEILPLLLGYKVVTSLI
jgi:hypothetical protein